MTHSRNNNFWSLKLKTSTSANSYFWQLDSTVTQPKCAHLWTYVSTIFTMALRTSIKANMKTIVLYPSLLSLCCCITVFSSLHIGRSYFLLLYRTNCKWKESFHPSFLVDLTLTTCCFCKPLDNQFCIAKWCIYLGLTPHTYLVPIDYVRVDNLLVSTIDLEVRFMSPSIILIICYLLYKMTTR